MQVYVVLFVLACIYMLPALAEINGTIPYQSSCDPAATNVACSNSSLCACATVSTGERVCTQQMSCIYGTECSPYHTCDKPDSTCVIDSRCSGKHLCYAAVLFSPQLCPPPNSAVGTD